MPRQCALTGRRVVSGHRVSHAVNRTKRTFAPNLHTATLYSESLGDSVRLRVSPQALRTVDRHGGLDLFLMQTQDRKLPEPARRLKRRLLRHQRKIDRTPATS